MAMLVQVLLAMYFFRPLSGGTLCGAVATTALGQVYRWSQQEDQGRECREGSAGSDPMTGGFQLVMGVPKMLRLSWKIP